MKLLNLLLVAALGGCVYTPERLEEEGLKYERTSKQPPAVAADCFAKNAAATGKWQATRPRKMMDRSGLRVTVRTFGMVDFEPAVSGSRITALVQPIYGRTAGSLIDDLLDGC